MDVSEADAMEMLDMMVSMRYPGFDGMDFLAAYSDGLADSMFPDSHDLQVLASEFE